MDDRKLIFIVGVPHSGSTIFWRAFRKNMNFVCFGEPLTETIAAHLPLDNEKKTFGEYCQIFGDRPEDFWEIYQPIAPLEEADTKIGDRKIRYMRSLCER